MAGRHVRKAPVVISRVIATVMVSALLLAVGVVAATIFTGGERRATGGPQAQAPHTTRPSAVPTRPTTRPTRDGSPGHAPGGSSSRAGAGGGAVVGAVDSAGSDDGGTALPAQALALPGSSGTTSAGGVAPVGLPISLPGGGALARGWLQGSDDGRAHGKALGLRGRVATGHGCRPAPTKAKPLRAQPEPRACR